MDEKDRFLPCSFYHMKFCVFLLEDVIDEKIFDSHPQTCSGWNYVGFGGWGIIDENNLDFSQRTHSRWNFWGFL